MEFNLSVAMGNKNGKGDHLGEVLYPFQNPL